MSVAMVIDRCSIEKVTMAFNPNGEVTAYCLHAELTLSARDLQSPIFNRDTRPGRFGRNRGLSRRRIASHQSEENAYKKKSEAAPHLENLRSPSMPLTRGFDLTPNQRNAQSPQSLILNVFQQPMRRFSPPNGQRNVHVNEINGRRLRFFNRKILSSPNISKPTIEKRTNILSTSTPPK